MDAEISDALDAFWTFYSIVTPDEDLTPMQRDAYRELIKAMRTLEARLCATMITRWHASSAST